MDDCQQKACPEQGRRDLEILKLRLEVIGLTIQNHQLSIPVLHHKWQEVQAQIKAMEETADSEAGGDA